MIETPIKISYNELKEQLTSKGYQLYDYINEKFQNTILIRQYFIAFLKIGSIRGRNEVEAAFIQKERLAHFGQVYALGHVDISRPFGYDGNIRGVTFYNVPTLNSVNSLANAYPTFKAVRLEIEMYSS